MSYTNSKEIPESPEAVAYQLMTTIFYVEGKLVINHSAPFAYLEETVTREHILSTYKECLAVVKG